MANIIPEDVHDLCEAYLNGNVKKAMKMQLNMMDLCDKLFIEVNPIPIKNAMNMLGMNVGDLRMPLCDLEEANAQKVRQALKDYGLKVVK